MNESDTTTRLPVITVTLTPAVDVSLTVPTLEPGTLHRLPGVRQDPGGKGINVSKALKSFGVPTLATGFLGGDRGRWIEDRLDEAGIGHQFVHTQDETRMNVKVTEENGRLTEFNSLSPACSTEAWQSLVAWLLESLQKDQWITFCGRLPDGVSADWYARAIQAAKDIGAKIVLDASGEGLEHGVQAAPHVVKPNRLELSRLLNRDLNTTREIVDACQKLLQTGIQTVVVSLGEDGLIGAVQDEILEVKVPKVTAVSSVGAGDTLVAGLLYGIYHDYSFSETLRFAAASGTAAASTPGTAQPTLVDVQSLLSQVTVKPYL
ncbi:1-phosphofructokinase [Alicyclobacillus ferrooxydans]|uniref:Tagatose-6-phosphate kinase n=1 Tax=Alicyclobacillus ferrooxydans TaxID=471514 RepID=A0A0P9EJC9_9BACL|nr:1-phosphofructokinase [Alicyclobacillus ferrooxydans]KPV43058.1 hypothetical protein AN477_14005 [Alicyclobacillus ferrooxydans]